MTALNSYGNSNLTGRRRCFHIVVLIVLLSAGFAMAQPTERGNPAVHPAVKVPFDITRTAGTVSLLGDGGALDAISTDGDPGQIASIRTYLRKKGHAFANGDVSTPASLPPEAALNMTKLRARINLVTVMFEDLPAGGRLRLTTRDRALIPMLWGWLIRTGREVPAELRIGVPLDARIYRGEIR